MLSVPAFARIGRAATGGGRQASDRGSDVAVCAIVARDWQTHAACIGCPGDWRKISGLLE